MIEVNQKSENYGRIVQSPQRIANKEKLFKNNSSVLTCVKQREALLNDEVFGAFLLISKSVPSPSVTQVPKTPGAVSEGHKKTLVPKSEAKCFTVPKM